MKKTIIILSTLFVAFISCNNAEQKTDEKINEVNLTEELHIQEEVIVEEEHHHEDITILLNDGKKWKVVESMLVYIRNMEAGVNDFEDNSERDYPRLAKSIDENIRELTSNCTMEGQAHDELHKWLVPFIELSEEFDVATELADQERIYNEFKASFEVFHTYFE